MKFDKSNRFEQRFPCVADMQAAAERRLPKFARDYLFEAIGRGLARDNNRKTLDAVKFTPRYLSSAADHPDCAKTLFGHTFDAPFGVAPIGLGGLIWPRAAEYLARAAHTHNIPFILSSYATTSLEKVAHIAREHAWYQFYATVDEGINEAVIERAKQAGYEVMAITVDVPQPTDRAHDIRNGLAVPPKFDLRTVLAIATRPSWAIASARAGLPSFENITPHLPSGLSLEELSLRLAKLGDAHISIEQLKWFRDRWAGKLIVKGILSGEDAEQCRSIGIDAISVSNHGGRQLESSRSPVEALPEIRSAVGNQIVVLADGGARTGADIATLLACGADFVLLGRAFMFAVAAMGEPGASHVMDVLKREFSQTVSQLGCANIESLPERLANSSANSRPG